MIDYNDTVTLMQAMERVKPPASFLLDTFFPNIPTPALTPNIMVEYRKVGRKLAPFIVPNSKGINSYREGSNIDIYKPPMIGPKRSLSEEDISKRGFGEGIYSSTSPDERATQIQARDLNELQNRIINTKNYMAAQILTTGQCAISGYADDGKLQKIDTLAFSAWDQKITPTTTWDNASADIYGDLQAASYMIQESAGIIPTIGICGKNIGEYILQNSKIMEWLLVPNPANLTMMGLQPKLVSPQVMYLGRISTLNLELYSYMETYTDDSGNIQPYIPPDDVIVGIPGRGRQLHGAVTIVENKQFRTYSGLYVPRYTADEDSNILSLAMYSRCVLAPEFVDDWALIKAKG